MRKQARWTDGGQDERQEGVKDVRKGKGVKEKGMKS